ncbi:MAG: DUF4345 domain-containing protein [Bacteroidetes bacterium]|nr:DUF4345 domain-containing protein [Bacteroidota bacterium]MBS1633937.1 DUF4345 domain-containing protein [Bacteroidota bacterium]
MTLSLTILLGLVALICFLGGLNIIFKGAMHFLPKEQPAQPILDNLVRFLGGIYFGCGFLLAYSAFHAEELGNITYFLGIVVLFSGLGRLFSRYKLGSAGRYFDFIMIVEMLLGLSIILLAWLR